jgi:hypothetical protein
MQLLQQQAEKQKQSLTSLVHVVVGGHGSLIMAVTIHTPQLVPPLSDCCAWFAPAAVLLLPSCCCRPATAPCCCPFCLAHRLAWWAMTTWRGQRLHMRVGLHMPFRQVAYKLGSGSCLGTAWRHDVAIHWDDCSGRQSADFSAAARRQSGGLVCLCGCDHTHISNTDASAPSLSEAQVVAHLVHVGTMSSSAGVKWRLCTQCTGCSWRCWQDVLWAPHVQVWCAGLLVCTACAAGWL